MAAPAKPVCDPGTAANISLCLMKMEVSMFGESSMLPRRGAGGRAGEPGEEIGTVHKVAALVLSLAIAGGIVVAMPVALLYL
jgi:hypothetical protein